MVDIGRLKPLGRFAAEAANEAGQRVVADLFRLDIGSDERPEAAAEVDAIAWISVNAPAHIPMAPLTEYFVPLLYRQIIAAGKGR